MNGCCRVSLFGNFMIYCPQISNSPAKTMPKRHFSEIGGNSQVLSCLGVPPEEQTWDLTPDKAEVD